VAAIAGGTAKIKCSVLHRSASRRPFQKLAK
jgi:hypothetical protein